MTPETKKVLQTIAIVGAETAVTVIIFRIAMRPDSLRLTQMRVLRASERLCQRNAEVWAHAADASHTLYDSARNLV